MERDFRYSFYYETIKRGRDFYIARLGLPDKASQHLKKLWDERYNFWFPNDDYPVLSRIIVCGLPLILWASCFGLLEKADVNFVIVLYWVVLPIATISLFIEALISRVDDDSIFYYLPVTTWKGLSTIDETVCYVNRLSLLMVLWIMDYKLTLAMAVLCFLWSLFFKTMIRYGVNLKISLIEKT